MCAADSLVRATSMLFFAAACWGGGTKARAAGKKDQQYCWGATGQPGDGGGEEDKG